jgi:hypothetical protein
VPADPAVVGALENFSAARTYGADDMKFVVNTMPRGFRNGFMHWWLRTPAGRHQRAYLESIGRWVA